MKVVLDTNVLLAAFATRGLCEAVFEAVPGCPTRLSCRITSLRNSGAI